MSQEPAKRVCSYPECGIDISHRHGKAIRCEKHRLKHRPRKDGPRVDKDTGAAWYADTMRSLYQSGKTLAEIGEIYGVSRERVRQILNRKYGLTRKNGGQVERRQRAKRLVTAQQDRKCLEKWGMTYKEYRRITVIKDGNGLSAGRAFTRQKMNANTRGVGWNLNFRQWWDIWQTSGKWNLRGRGMGKYCMSRVGDTGAYEIGNAFIQEFAKNSSEGRILAFETEKPKALAFEVIIAAGGRAPVAAATNSTPAYISQIACNGRFPAVWADDGRLDNVIRLTHGKFSKKQVIELSAA